MQKVSKIKSTKGGYEVHTPEGIVVRHKTKEMAKMEKEMRDELSKKNILNNE
jgi:hypothetical protein